MRFGLPYKGSKNKIAPWIISNLPSADVFVDLFCTVWYNYIIKEYLLQTVI